MSRLTNVFDFALRRALANRCSSKHVLAINGAGAATVKTTNPITYTIDGVIYQKAALAAQSMAPTNRFNKDAVTAADPAYVQPANTTAYYVLSADVSGNIAVSQGSYAGQAIAFSTDISKVYAGTGDLPHEPDGFTAFGVVKVATGNGVTFTPGTTALDAASLTVGFFDVACLYNPL